MGKKNSKSEKIVKEKLKKHVPFALRVSMDIISVDESASVSEVAKVLEKNKIGAVVVTSGGCLVGIISERDIVHRVVAQEKAYAKLTAKDIMTKDVVTVNLEEGLKAIHEQMKNLPFRHLPVRNGNKVVGMVSNRDLMYLRRLKTIHSP